MPNEKVLNEKKQAVAELVEKLKNAASGVIVDYRGLTVADDTALRAKLREANVDYKVIKNTFCKFAIKEVNLEELDPVFNGPTAIAMSTDDPIAPAKIISDFAKTNEALEIKSGFMDGAVLSINEIKSLAATPSRETLLATILSSLNAPASNLVRTLQAIVDTGVEPADLAAKKTADAPAEEVPVADAPAEEAPAQEAAPEAPAEEVKEEAAPEAAE